ncbi:MAG: RHS repeat-associated core domain-containing protein, partial [Sodaliphilus sp.]|nr:RHS repeat-associated core domain-containing protein [Sodaliphilus sp.]
MTTSSPPRNTKKRLIKTVGAHMLCSCGYMQDGGLYFYIKDYQGNVRVVLNQANQPVEVNSYYPYGGLMAATTEGTQPYKYSPKELDRENGLDLYDSKARMYDPTIGRTPTQDPMAEKYYS